MAVSSLSAIYFLDVTMNGQDFSRGLYVFEAVPAMTISELVPSIGSTRGGATITVIGAGMRQNDGLMCHFGPDTTTEGTFLSRSEVKCASPMSTSLPVSVAVSLSMGKETSTGEVNLRLSDVAATVEFVAPRSGGVSGGTHVVVRKSFQIQSGACDIGERGLLRMR